MGCVENMISGDGIFPSDVKFHRFRKVIFCWVVSINVYNNSGYNTNNNGYIWVIWWDIWSYWLVVDLPLWKVIFWLVVKKPSWKMMEFVNGKDDIHSYEMENQIPWFETTNHFMWFHMISSDFIHVSAQISGGLTHVVSFPNIQKPWIPSTAPCLGRPRRWPAARSWPLSASAAASERWWDEAV